jgi:glycosyltransferase involved in cell wall biosynthesis
LPQKVGTGASKFRISILNLLFAADVSIHEVIGGSERVLFEQSYRLAAKGHNVHVLTRRLPVHGKNQNTIRGVTEWRYAVNQANDVLFFTSTWRNSARLFASLHQKFHFDCINFHQPFSSLGVLNSTFCRKIPKIYTCHSLSFEEYVSRNQTSGGIARRAIRRLNALSRKLLERRVLTQSDKIIVLSRYTAQKLEEIYRIPSAKILLLPGGVDSDRYFPAENKADIRRALDMPLSKVILFTVRNLVPRMGLENLLYAFDRVVQIVPDIYLVIGGKGPLQKDLSALTRTLGIEDQVRFTGFIQKEQLSDYYRMADMFILPTRELEGFGLVTLEALASGLPVLGTPVGGTEEILGQLDKNFLFADTSPGSIVDLILEKYRIIRENPQKWQEIRQTCRLFVEEHYSWEKNVDYLEELFLRFSSCQKRAGSIAASISG